MDRGSDRPVFEGRTSPRLVTLPHCDQSIVLIERQPAKHYGVDHGKDRRAGANAEHEDQQGDHRKCLGGLERAEGGFQIVSHSRVRRRNQRLC